MAGPYDADWVAPESITNTKLNKTTYGQGTSFPNTWKVDRVFWRTDENRLYKNVGTEGTPSWTHIAKPWIFGDGSAGNATNPAITAVAGRRVSSGNYDVLTINDVGVTTSGTGNVFITCNKLQLDSSLTLSHNSSAAGGAGGVSGGAGGAGGVGGTSRGVTIIFAKEIAGTGTITSTGNAGGAGGNGGSTASQHTGGGTGGVGGDGVTLFTLATGQATAGAYSSPVGVSNGVDLDTVTTVKQSFGFLSDILGLVQPSGGGGGAGGESNISVSPAATGAGGAPAMLQHSTADGGVAGGTGSDTTSRGAGGGGGGGNASFLIIVTESLSGITINLTGGAGGKGGNGVNGTTKDGGGGGGGSAECIVIADTDAPTYSITAGAGGAAGTGGGGNAGAGGAGMTSQLYINIEEFWKTMAV